MKLFAAEYLRRLGNAVARAARARGALLSTTTSPAGSDWQARFLLRPGHPHRRRLQRGAAQHHGGAGPRPAPGAAGRPGRAVPRSGHGTARSVARRMDADAATLTDEPGRPPRAGAPRRARARRRPAATTPCRCATSPPPPAWPSARSTATSPPRTTCSPRPWSSGPTTSSAGSASARRKGDTIADRVADVLRRATRAMEKEPKLSEAVVTALSSPDRGAAACQEDVSAAMTRILVAGAGRRLRPRVPGPGHPDPRPRLVLGADRLGQRLVGHRQGRPTRSRSPPTSSSTSTTAEGPSPRP